MKNHKDTGIYDFSDYAEEITELLTHSLFIIEEKSTNSISTLSYNGAVLLPFSKRAWGLNTAFYNTIVLQ